MMAWDVGGVECCQGHPKDNLGNLMKRRIDVLNVFDFLLQFSNSGGFIMVFHHHLGEKSEHRLKV